MPGHILQLTPNLQHGKGKAESIESLCKCQDEHNCIAAAFQQLIDLNRRGGEDFVVKGKEVRCKVFIHCVIGDTQGNNVWLGHFNGSGRLKRPYRDCECCFDDMDNSNPQCKYVTQESMQAIKRRRLNATSKTKAEDVDKEVSKHNVRRIFDNEDMPLSDEVHGIYGMTPPELLHASYSGIIEYSMVTLEMMFGNKNVERKALATLDRLHQELSLQITRNSDRDSPRGSARNGIIDSTKTQSTERRGNFFRLLCLSYTDTGKQSLRVALDTEEELEYFQEFIKLYLAMEEWFHEVNDKDEVRNSRDMIAEVLDLLKYVFQRDVYCPNTQGWKIPKFHAMTKVQTFMCKYGSAMNFYGGPGESHHKYFVKAPGENTQRRVSEFVSQVANRVYETLVMEQASELVSRSKGSSIPYSDEDDAIKDLRGKWTLTLEPINDSDSYSSTVRWDFNAKNKPIARKMHKLDNDLIWLVEKACIDKGIKESVQVRGCTECHIGGVKYRASPWYRGMEWYDFGLVEFIGRRGKTQTYPSQILGFAEIPNDHPLSWGDGCTIFAFVQVSTEQLDWETLEENFISKFVLSSNVDNDLCMVPATSIIHPMLVFKNLGGGDNEFFCSLPKRNWGRYFGDRIQKDEAN